MYALGHYVERPAVDHANAPKLALGLSAHADLTVTQDFFRRR